MSYLNDIPHDLSWVIIFDIIKNPHDVKVT